MKNLSLYLRAQALRFQTLRAYRRSNWREIPIHDNREPLVEIPKEMCHPFYHVDMKIWHDSQLFIRQEVFKNFLWARNRAGCYGFELVVYDGWRSIELQEKLFWHYLKEFTVGRFGLQGKFSAAVGPAEICDVFLSLPVATQEAMKEKNRTYVSWPSADLMAPSPHATGGAIDVWLHKNGQPVNLGVPFDWMEEEAGAFYHLKIKRKRFVGDDGSVSRCRNILLRCMAAAGFSCYGPEIWHFNYGNQMHALVEGGIARYSYIEP